DPLFVALLAEIALVRRYVETRNHLRHFLSRHAAPDFLCLLAQEFLVLLKLSFRTAFRELGHTNNLSDLNMTLTVHQKFQRGKDGKRMYSIASRKRSGQIDRCDF